MSLKTDSTPLESPKILKGSVVGDLFGLFAPKDQFLDLEERLNRGGLGWGHAKTELFDVINNDIRDSRERYFELRRDEKLLQKILSEGAVRAFEIGETVLNRVRNAVGFGPNIYKPIIK